MEFRDEMKRVVGKEDESGNDLFILLKSRAFRFE